MIFPRLDPAELLAPRCARIPESVVRRAAEVVADVRARGEQAVEEYANRFDERGPDEPLFLDRKALESALASAPAAAAERLQRIASRIRGFAEAQRRSLEDLTVEIPGGWAGHTFAPVERAGCYAPGGRYPLPSSALMTVIPARAAGVESVWLASPRPQPVMLWAAAVAGADGLLATGGAQAIASLAFGVRSIPPSDVVVGPGNLWVTAAKQLVSDRIAIDLPAGPSELLVIGDASSNPDLVAADLLAQAEHDATALPLLISTRRALIDAVEDSLARQLADLPTAETALLALASGGALLCNDEAEAVRLANAIAPEHLQLSVAEPERLAPQLTSYGALFLGDRTAEVLGDYGAGPNHVLPTGGAARYSGGLSVLSFLRMRTWMRQDEDRVNRQLIEDTVWLARQEGLEAHARAAAKRLEMERST
jgi:phosphoribosyl-ATP pyrophosphohydrolase/phosphoribosyl-AMP cyclohydrolase/histidinol dehydrogenase